MTFIGIDNGISGTIGFITSQNKPALLHTPIKEVLNYTKSKQFLNRLDGEKFREILIQNIPASFNDTFCLVERPMINPMRWKASVSAIRCMEATITILENMGVPYGWLDSKEWQKSLLPKGLQKNELKIASLDVGKRLFPSIDFNGFDDADGILIAEHCRRTFKSKDNVN